MFIHGARGSGKSIMLRSLESKVQRLLNTGGNSELGFFAIHIPIKDNFFGNPEYRRLTGWKSTTVGEHLLAVYTMFFLCESLFEEGIVLEGEIKSEFIELWEDCGGKTQVADLEKINDFEELARFCDRETTRVRQYYVRLPTEDDPDIYSGALTSFSDFLFPFCRCCQRINKSVMSQPYCFMLDDADNLPEALQKVLNSWISTRTASSIFFKVSTQLGYKTFRTIDNRVIESPHDFSEVNIGTVYTSSKANFAKRIYEIVKKRLENANISTKPEEFFPLDYKQEQRRKQIWKDLNDGITDPHVELRSSGPSRKRDLAQRYTKPALMRELSHGKSAHTFSYAGMQSLTDLSAGVVRWFLEPAGQMYDRVESSQGDRPSHIPVGIQDEVIAVWSRNFREALNADPGAADEEHDEASLQSVGHSKENYQKLANLLDGMGGWCRERLLDKTVSEQKVFSFALNDQPTSDLSDILDLGVRMGYLQKADLASKSAFGGRRPRYIISRRLGPHYRLDISGYAAHLSVTCLDLELAILDPKKFIKRQVRESPGDQLQGSIDFGEPE